MFLFIQSVIIIICLSILSVYMANAKIDMPKRRKKITASHSGESKWHKNATKNTLDHHWGSDNRSSKYASRYIGHA